MRRFLQSVLLLTWFAGLLGIVYPFVLTLFANLTWNESARGSLLLKEGKVRGSLYVGQAFTEEGYFWPRPSGSDFATLPSQGPDYRLHSERLAARLTNQNKYLGIDHGITEGSAIPPGLIFASASGIDPDIMLPSALFQVERVAKARGLNTKEGQAKVIELVMQAKVKKPLNLFGRDCVNVLLLNQSLDNLMLKSNP